MIMQGIRGTVGPLFSGLAGIVPAIWRPPFTHRDVPSSRVVQYPFGAVAQGLTPLGSSAHLR